MKTLYVYDPPMCCSSGVCGPSVDTRLLKFNAALKALKARGIAVQRYNAAQDHAAFAASSTVTQAIERGGMECLPLILLDGDIVSRGVYPAEAALLRLLGLEPAPAVGGEA